MASAIASRVPSSSRWTGPMLVIAATSGSAIPHSSAIWPRPRIAISSTSTSRLGRRRQHGERQADLGVVVLRAGVDAHGQDRVADVLDRGLAHRAGDPDHRAAELAPPGACERLERGQRVGRGEHPAASIARPRLAARQRASALPARPPPPRPRPRARRRRSPRRRHARPAGRRTGRPARSLARVDHRPLGPPAPPATQDLGPGRGRDPLWGRARSRGAPARHNPARARRSLAAPPATSRSSKGIFLPPSNS